MSIWFKRASERGYDKVRDGIATGPGRSLREPPGRAHRHRAQPAALQRRDAPRRRRRLPRRQQLHRPHQRRLRPGLAADQRLRPGAHPGHRRRHVPPPSPGDQPGPADRVLPLREPVLLADPAAGPAVQHVPAGPGVGVQAPHPARDRAQRRRGAGRACELPPIRGEIRFDHVSFGYDPAVPGAPRRRPDHRPRGDRGVRRAPPARASRPWPSWSPASTTRPAGRVLIDGYDLKARHARVAAPPARRRAPGAVPLRRDHPGQHRPSPARARPTTRCGTPCTGSGWTTWCTGSRTASTRRSTSGASRSPRASAS